MMNLLLPSWMFSTLIWGSLSLALVGSLGLLGLFFNDVRKRQTW